jgi:hypothetical protein
VLYSTFADAERRALSLVVGAHMHNHSKAIWPSIRCGKDSSPAFLSTLSNTSPGLSEFAPGTSSRAAICIRHILRGRFVYFPPPTSPSLPSHPPTFPRSHTSSDSLKNESCQ